MPQGRGARAEAFDRLGGRYDVRVLEPSPPTVRDGPFLADDPVDGGEIVPLLRPGTRSWDELCDTDGDETLAAWSAERWLARWKLLTPLPASFVETRTSLHAVAEHVIAPARHTACGKIGLRYTRDGFGTPFFGEDRQVRVERGVVIRDDPVGIHREPLLTLRQVSVVADVAPGTKTGVYTPNTPGDLDARLAVDVPAATALGDWFGFCASVLEQLRAETPGGPGASRVQLWPEHFDLAIDLGDEAAGQRANYGGSPGDAGHPHPYLYIGPWVPASGPFWSEPFGASLGYDELLTATDQREAALSFLRRGRDLLSGAFADTSG